MKIPATILVIDDDQYLVQLLKTDLEEEGYRVVVGYEGRTAQQLARTHRPQLILLDVHMPMVNGLKALEFLRQSPETHSIPVIILTGGLSATVYPAMDSTSRVAVLKKPTDLEHLNSVVREFLNLYPTAT